jgi:mannose-6-phosphate isomerase
MTVPILKLSPHLKPRPWGGNRLRDDLRKAVPQGEKIGESWELSDRPDGPSRIEGGPFEGRLFGEVLREYPRETLGETKAPEKYPLLVKYIDAAEDLSIQVHPDDAYARERGLDDRGKTECWYILGCDPGTEVVYGLSEGIDRKKLEKAIAEQRVPEVVRRIPISPGTFLFVPPGTVHAILGGTLLCEVQQSSNITYRLWDWGRKPKREVHIRESLDVIDYNPKCQIQPFRLPTDEPRVPRIIPLTHNPFFLVYAIQLGPGQTIRRSHPGCGTVLNGVGGECLVDSIPVRIGDTLFVPACLDSITFSTSDSPATVLLSRANA